MRVFGIRYAMRNVPLARHDRFGRQVVERTEMIGRMEIKLVWFGMAALTCVIACSDGQNETSSAHVSHEGVMQEAGASRGSSEPVPEEYQAGEERFNALCSRCHGLAGRGTNMGPPLVHKIYEPSHHADFAFMRAAMQGVRAHHWKFGDMPRIPEATSDQVTTIVTYVRWLQRQAGIY